MTDSLVAFDMVGVVLDEERVVSKALWNMLPEPRKVPRDELKKRYDDGLRLGHLSAEEFWANVVDEPWPKFERKFLDSLRFTPGAQDAMTEIARHKRVAVVSDLPSRWARPILARAGLDATVSLAVFADEHGGARKKDGQLLQILVREAELPATRVVLIDDTVANVIAAEKIGIIGIWFEREGRDSGGFRGPIIHNFDELSEHLTLLR
jgi:HAD superfamily hydrolase (TIGR01509 family)